MGTSVDCVSGVIFLSMMWKETFYTEFVLNIKQIWLKNIRYVQALILV